MADFTKAYNRTGINEGLWSNVIGDAGGETWKGIARNLHPNWEAWTLIDFIKSGLIFPEKPTKKDIDKLNKALLANEKLELSVRKFYKNEFWDKTRGDEILIQLIAESIYDSSVNMGYKQAIKLAQRSAALKESGIMDDITLNKLNNKA